MIASERVSYILGQLKEKDTVTLKDISSELGVSIATIRRDFEKLDEKGLVAKVRSGATRVGVGMSAIPPALVTSEKTKENIDAKIAIAKKAASFVQDGDRIFLDGGTTVAPMIDFIQDKKIKIVTPNLLIPQKLKNMDIDIFLVGGHYSHFHASTVGVYAEKMVSQFHFDHAFFGCSGIENLVAYNDDIDTIPVKEVAMKVSSHNYLLVDSSKLGVTSYCRLCQLSAFDYVICNRGDGADDQYPPNFLFAEE